MPDAGIAEAIASETALPIAGVRAVLALFEDGGTVPFIARYRKETTGGLDEVAIMDIRDRSAALVELGKRRTAIMASCEEQDVLSEALKKSLAGARTMAELEDLYLPYKPKRRTRAMMAKERGLDGLAVYIMKQKNSGAPLWDVAVKYVSEENGVESVDDAIAGARDIIAESASEHAPTRGRMRRLYARSTVIYASESKKAQGDAGKYRDYYGTETSVRGAPSHRILAL
ncbi:MAG: RNA-binding transcriptional accessory protein, partial [Synergistaceae bacterium]|nr:RNA-binding transcriptional accessory protein [Synergistaceae bacterium]